MAYSLFQEVHLQILKQDDLQLSSPRNRLVLSGAEFLLHIAKEGSRDDRMVQAITIFCSISSATCNPTSVKPFTVESFSE